ncbi:PTS system, ascorbate-specific IIA component [Enterococcus sp. AZ194]|uniref:PTS sugar transporter subunit IIA n=1 Tax=Enterococcus sp. AZ194 TaxID=2774629 RepID=UPI003F23DF7E
MLRYFLENDLVYYSESDSTDWKEAIQESCTQLLQKQIIDQTYVDEIIHCVNEHGPYIVIVPGVAMPHSSEDSQGVFGTAISFTKMKQPIIFDSEQQEEKSASLFFTLAAKNAEEHMQNIQNLSELLMTDGLIDDLLQTQSIEEFKTVGKEYNL